MADAVPPTQTVRDIGECQTPGPCGAIGCHGHCDAAQRFAEYEAESERMTAARECAYPIPWWHRTVSGLALAAWLLGCVALCAGVCWLMGGCAVGYKPGPDGTPDYADPVIGISTGTANAAGAGLLSLGGLLSGNPAVVGLAALVANQMGKRSGWDEREQAASVQAPLPTEKRA